MSNKTAIKIAFLGRKQNAYPKYNSRFQDSYCIEKPRLNEESGLEKSNLIKINDINNSDIVMLRINPEQTNKKTLKRIQNIESKIPSSSYIINSSKHFNKYADKSQSFSQWSKNDITCPDYLIFSPWQSLNKSISILQERLNNNGPQYVRTNNEDSGKGIYYFTKKSSDSEIKKALKRLRLRSIFNRTSNSKIISVSELNNCNKNGIRHIFRAHVCGDKILGGYALVSDKKVFHAKDLQIKHWDEYIQSNKELISIFNSKEKYKTIIKAAKTLGVDLGAVEFFLIDGNLSFLEINPKWGGLHTFGNEEFMLTLEENINEPELIYVKKWLDSKQFYTNLYNTIESQFIKARSS